MTQPIGFVLLINPFNPLEQTARLIGTLNRMFNNPPIVCHHDFGKAATFLVDLPSNVELVRPHIDTRWGDFSCVEAAIHALRLLYSKYNYPEWFIYLSGSDYPIKPAHKILSDLQSGSFDGYIEHRDLTGGNLIYDKDSHNPQGWKWDTWLKQCHKRYCSLRFDLLGINRYLKLSKRTFWLEHRIFTAGRIPFSNQFKCYAGEAWFCGNHKCAKEIIKFYENDVIVANHYRKTLVPEESYFHTVLANAHNLKLSQNFLRYIDWTEHLSNPKILTSGDLPKLIKSDAHFARKFDSRVDSLILDELDKLII